MKRINQLAKWSVGLVVTGAIITFLGFALSGFSIERYADHSNHWYNTVHLYK